MTVEIKCSIKGSDDLFKGPTGKKFRVNCPRNCGS